MYALKKVLRREFLPAAIFIFFLAPCANTLFSQEQQENVKTKISNTGIIQIVPVEEKVAEEDVNRISALNEDSEKEYEKSEQKQSDEIDELFGEEEDDFDSIFDESSEIQKPVVTTTTETVKVDPKDKPITFTGHLKAELGGYVWLKPLDSTKPLANFRNVLKFTGRPRTDFYVTGSLLTEFPKMDIGVYELYFNYTLFGRADLAAGKRDVSWNVSRMLDTNCLDDTASSILVKKDDSEGLLTNIFQKRDRGTTDSKFTVSFKIPFLSYFSLQGVSQYYGGVGGSSVSNNYLSIAGKLEATFGKFSLSFYGMRYPTILDPSKGNYNTTKPFIDDDESKGLKPGVVYERMNPVLGGEIVSTILGSQSNMFLQAQFNIASEESRKFNHAKLTTGVYKYFPAPIMLGIAFEYQFMYHKNNGGEDFFGTGKKFQNYFAAQISWSHFILDRKCTFGCEWFHDKEVKYGAVMPVMKIENIFKYTDFRFAFPIYYGSVKKYGLVFEMILNLDY